MINSSPPAVIFINKGITSGIQSVLVRQLYISEVISEEEFALRITNDPNYASVVKFNNLRILVLKDYKNNITTESTSQADIVLYSKNGLIYVEENKVGPTGLTLSTDKIYLSELFFRQ